MNIDLVVVGKTDLKEVEALVAMYSKRIGFYTNFKIITIPDLKNRKSLSEESQKSAEGEMILKAIASSDHLVLLDERGREHTSVEFSSWLEKKMVGGVRRLVFVIGGPYGFSKGLYDRANEKISLSQMTFSHQIIRAVFTEQLYRAFTIINSEPYHHQ